MTRLLDALLRLMGLDVPAYGLHGGPPSEHDPVWYRTWLGRDGLR